ncbi:MAG: M16 family metallopeptidase, partial [Beijerinckiaceae bacterium]
AFKGTRRRSAHRIVEEIEHVGGDLNASTTVENTNYHVRLMGDDLPVALDIFADILLNSTFDDAEIKREKSVVLQEIGAAEDAPEELIYDLFLERAFPGQPLGRQILGTKQSVRDFSRDGIRNYLAREYRAPAMVVSAVGAVDHARTVEAAARLFESLPKDKPPQAQAGLYRGGETRLNRKLEQVHLVMGFPGRSIHDADQYAVHAFASILGGGMSSRLFQEVREKRGLAYSIDAMHWAFEDCGVFGISAGTAEDDAEDLIRVSLDELQRAGRDITQAELDGAKAQMKVALMSAYESAGQRTEQLARQWLSYGRLIPPDEILARIDTLSVATVQDAGRAVLSGPPTLTVMGPARRVPHLQRIAEWTGAPMPGQS